MKNRLPTALAVTALIVALMGWTGAANAISVAFAQNAAKLAGFKASKKAKKNTVVVRGKNGKIDAASIPAQARGARGATGATGPPGAQGTQGIQGIQGIQGPPGAPNPNAVNAENADKLNGKAANELLRVAKSDPETTTISFGATAIPPKTVTITAPGPGFVLVTGSVTGDTIFGGSAGRLAAGLRYEPAGAPIQQSLQQFTSVAASQLESIAVSWVFSVAAAGPATFSLVGQTGGPVARNRVVNALYVPFGSTGGSTLAHGLLKAHSPVVLEKRDGASLMK